MLPTLVIGLREGMEAALIVGIIAAFLVKNGQRLTSMWIGVGAAVALSLGIGLTLHFVVDDLPQRPQEAMETVIGAVAIVFVTGMVLWMSTHARFMKKELERSAASALTGGTARALAIMAFLAVLKEGFETSVFLLATFQNSGNATLAASGAAIGIVIAVGIGIGLYRGGISINLGRFFKATSAFLILVAAGLVVGVLGTAHEAGWLDGGQQATVDLSWLAPGGSSVQGALVTGVLGVPPHPVLIQVIGWLAYLVPMSLLLFWPARRRITPRSGLVVRAAAAGALLVTAGVLALTITPPQLPASTSVPLVSGGAAGGTATLGSGSVTIQTAGAAQTLPLADGVTGDHDGVAPVTLYSPTRTTAVTGLPATLTLDQLFTLNGNRLPVGISASRNPGPFTATWSRADTAQIWLTGGVLLDATGSSTLVLTISGGGLDAPRTQTVPAGATIPGTTTTASSGWQVDPAYTSRITAAAIGLGSAQAEHRFWGRQLPVGLAIGALLVLLVAGRRWRQLRGAPPAVAQPETTTEPPPSAEPAAVGAASAVSRS